MVKITLEFETVQKAMDALFKLGATADRPEEPSTNPKSSRKAKEEEVSVPLTPRFSVKSPGVTTPRASPEEPAVLLPATLTLEMARVALRDLYARTNAATATKVLQDFGATSISTVPVVKYADFIKACTNAK